MDYYVSIENNIYHYWQISLLIESFIQKKIEDKLHIAVADTKRPEQYLFGFALDKHLNKFIHYDLGQEYDKLNTIGSLIFALEEKLISQPFALLNPDMILVEEPIVKGNISCSREISPDTDEIKMRLGKDKKQLEKHFSNAKIPDLPLGDVLVFNDVPIDFFKRVLENMKTLYIQSEKEMVRYGTQWNIYKAAWIITMYEYIPSLKIAGGIKEYTLLHNELDCNFINYKHGIPNVFHKRFHTYNSTFSLSGKNPYDIILENNVSQATNFVGNLIKKLKEREANL